MYVYVFLLCRMDHVFACYPMLWDMHAWHNIVAMFLTIKALKYEQPKDTCTCMHRSLLSRLVIVQGAGAWCTSW